MAKKLGKALIFTAVAGAIAAGGVALYNKYKASTDDFDDDFLDFDDEDDDFDDDLDDTSDDNAGRGYVSIPREDAAEEKDDDYKVNVDVSIADTFSDDEDDDLDDIPVEKPANATTADSDKELEL